MTDLIERHLTWLRQVRHAAETTVHSRGALLHRADRALPYGLDNSDENELAAFLSQWRGWSRTTYDTHLRGFYQWGVRFGHLTLDPMAELARPAPGPRVPHPCTDDELAIALTAPQWPWRRAVLLAAYGGLRCAEICSVTTDDLRDGWLTVLGKGGKTRAVPLGGPALADIEAYGPRRGHLLQDANGQPLAAHILTDRWGRMRHRLGLRQSVTMHSFRHWFASSTLSLGADIRTVQELLGHASLNTTQGYTQVTDARRLAAVAALPVLGHEPAGTRLVTQAA